MATIRQLRKKLEGDEICPYCNSGRGIIFSKISFKKQGKNMLTILEGPEEGLPRMWYCPVCGEAWAEGEE